jgi:hypothetical protein
MPFWRRKVKSECDNQPGFNVNRKISEKLLYLGDELYRRRNHPKQKETEPHRIYLMNLEDKDLQDYIDLYSFKIQMLSLLCNDYPELFAHPSILYNRDNDPTFEERRISYIEKSIQKLKTNINEYFDFGTMIDNWIKNPNPYPDQLPETVAEEQATTAEEQSTTGEEEEESSSKLPRTFGGSKKSFRKHSKKTTKSKKTKKSRK